MLLLSVRRPIGGAAILCNHSIPSPDLGQCRGIWNAAIVAG
jgi:hypothetical protein